MLQADLSPLRILIVDDHHDGAESLGVLLETVGCDVRVRYSGEAALALAPAFRPSLIILDIEMPGMSGLETAKRLREQSWFQHAVLASHSARSDRRTRELSRSAGCARHITKPAELDAFRELIDLVRRDH